MTILKMDLLSQNPTYSDDPASKGFDLSAAKSWIYPENYPIRNYQFSIVKTALYNNTLVCLPTGLGKTFIAAVLMYNYWRWYPQGKIIFLAPTRPLVAQQIAACHDVMGIPSSETVELTGSINQREREKQWVHKRVIFATPQVFHNDITRKIVPCDFVKCVVIDEAHKALGKHSYCECIRLLSLENQYFRILALSATPGNKIEKVHEIVQNLHISKIELRDETSLDIQPYVNERKIDIILVPLSKELAEFKERYLNIMDPHVKYLYQNKILPAQTANITKGRIFYILQEFKNSSQKYSNYGIVMKKLNMLLTMYHAYELMVRHGLRAFIKFYENHSDKFWMNSEHELKILLDDVQAYLGPFPDIHLLPHGEIPEVPEDIRFGHNKFYKLNELLVKHFKDTSKNQDTRAIVFVEYKDIVNEVYVLLLQLRPLIRPQMFVGQSGQKQRQQIKALENFRNNVVNVLISTSIGEEGLDVGEVDLIICFDISQQNPTRLVQRMGRTGRKRDGHIIVLVTDGKEHETLKSTMKRRDSLNSKILNTSNIVPSLYEHNPRMIPKEFTPECHKRLIVVQQEAPVNKRKGSRKKTAEKKLRGQSKLKKHFANERNKPDIEFQQENVQSSMSKFLINTKFSEMSLDNNNIRTPITTQSRDNIRNTIKPSNVKLLSSDNDAIDFLTLCAIKKSEKEAIQEVSKQQINMTYIPTPRMTENKNFFDFSIPDTKILDCLSSLDEAMVMSLTKENENLVNNVNFNYDMDDMDEPIWCNAFENFATRIENDLPSDPPNEIISGKLIKSRFEDLLDETSDSDKTVMSEENQNKKHEVLEKRFELNSGESLSADQILGGMDLDVFDDVVHDLPENNDGLPSVSEQRPFTMGRQDKTEAIYEDLFKDTDDESDAEVTIVEEIEPKQNNCQLRDDKQCVNFDDLQLGTTRNKNNNHNTVTTGYKPVQSIQEYGKSQSGYENKTLSSLSESASNMLELCTQQVKDAKTINKLIRQHFSRTQSTSDQRQNLSEEFDDTNVESEEDMFATDFDNVEKQLESIEKQFVEDENKNDVIVLDDSDDEKPVEIKKIECHTQRPCAQNEDRSDIRNEEIDLDSIEWDCDFRLSSTSVKKKLSNTEKPSTSLNSLKDSSKIPVAKLDTEKGDEGPKWISVNTKISSSNDVRPKLAKKLSKLSRSVTLNVKSTPKKCWSDNSDDDFDNDFTISNEDVKKISELESSFFTVKKETRETIGKASTSVANKQTESALTLNRNTARESVKNELSIFKAPSKYLKSNHNTSPFFGNRSQNQVQSNNRILKNNSFSTALKTSTLEHRTVSGQRFDSKKKKRGRLKSDFIEDEAEVSGEVSTDENSEFEDDLDGFISHTQHIVDEVDIQAHYLQTIRSPVKKPGAFIIKKLNSPDPEINLYSQSILEEHDTYINDSFCVDGDNDIFDDTEQKFGYTILEEAERALKKKRKRRDSTDSNDRKKNKYKKLTKNLLNTSVSSEDEMEKLRREIQDESVILKGLPT